MRRRVLDEVITRLASAGWQASGEAAPVDKVKWLTVAKAIYDELMEIDNERQTNTPA